MTREAMRAAGLAAEFTDSRTVFRNPMYLPPIGFALSVPSGYFSDAQTLVGTMKSVMPQLFGATRINRAMSIPEFSELPDGSHSISEYIAGNEICLPVGVSDATVDNLNRCHTFRAHMAALNSSHWVPLAEQYYRHYHTIALAIAARCKKMKDAISTPAPPLEPYLSELVISCEREALAFESYAAHFMQDNWSTGHMFHRWGSVFFGSSHTKQLQQGIAGLVVGLTHGARSITKAHDQLNMPGPWDDDDTNASRVRFGFPDPDTTIARAPGGGDMYLLECNQRTKDSGWFLASGDKLKFQRQAVMTCVTRGFEEVYKAGPMTRGALTPIGSDLLDEVKSSTDDFCFSARATNHSMWLGLGVGFTDTALGVLGFRFNPEDYADPSLLTKIEPSFGIDLLTNVPIDGRQLDLPGGTIEQQKARFRYVLGQLSLLYAQWGSRNPEGFRDRRDVTTRCRGARGVAQGRLRS